MDEKGRLRNNRRCIIHCCNSSSLRHPDLKFFRFPLPETPDYKIWLSACKDSYNQIRVLKKPLVCSLHFLPEDVGGRRLNPNAFPKLHLTGDGKEAINFDDREKKIKFLNQVMEEWLVRNRPHREIYGKLLLEMARQATDLLNIPSYVPDKTWLKDFTAQIADENSRPCGKWDTCGSALDLIDIIRDMAQLDQFSQMSRNEQSCAEGNTNSIEISDDEDNYNDGVYSEGYADLSSKLEVSVTVDEDKDYYEPSMKMPKLQSISLDLDDDYEDSKNDGKGKIRTYQDALKYMKPLEDFALLKEDFRAISLLAQLEAIFRQQP